MWHDHMWNGSWMMGLGWIPMLLFWVLIISLAFYLIRSVMGKSDDSALQILKDRLASGDIDQKEFDALFKEDKQLSVKVYSFGWDHAETLGRKTLVELLLSPGMLVFKLSILAA